MTNKKSFLRAQVQLWEQIPEEPVIRAPFDSLDKAIPTGVVIANGTFNLSPFRNSRGKRPTPP